MLAFRGVASVLWLPGLSAFITRANSTFQCFKLSSSKQDFGCDDSHSSTEENSHSSTEEIFLKGFGISFFSSLTDNGKLMLIKWIN